jgi:hypothetical protein
MSANFTNKIVTAKAKKSKKEKKKRGNLLKNLFAFFDFVVKYS